MEKFIWRNGKMLGILKNKNIKSIETGVSDNSIKIEMKLKKSIVEISKFGVFSTIYYFDNFIKSILTNNNEEDYLDESSYEYQFLIKDDKFDEELLFTILYNFILGYKNSTVSYDYYGYYNKKITNNILITYKADKNKIGIKINKNIFNKDVFENWE